MKQLTSIRDRYEQRLMAKANVVGVGIGFKKVGGKVTDKLSIIIMVERKLPETALSKEDIVDKELEGVPTDVQQVGTIKALAKARNQRMKKWRPAPGGVSIGHYETSAGTLGAAVTDRKTGETLILSNNHVLANENLGRPGDPVLQPGPYDGGTEKDRIAELHKFIPITLLPKKKRKTNRVDAAIALPERGSVDRRILKIGVLEGISQPELSMQVEKCGRTTGVTRGSVDVVETTVNMMYTLGQIAAFSHQVVLSVPARGGDSGSVVVSEKRAVGLLFAGGEKCSICNPMSLVADSLRIEI